MSLDYNQIVATATELQNQGRFREALEAVRQIRAVDALPEGHVTRLHELWEACLHQTLAEEAEASACLDDALVAALRSANRFEASTAWAWLEWLRPPLSSDWRCDFLRGMVADSDEDAHELALDYYDSALASFAPGSVLGSEFTILTTAAWSAGAAWLNGRAVGYLERALAIDPDHVWSLVRLGYAYGRTSRSDDAIRVLQRAISLEPGNQDAYFNLGLIHYERREYDEAMAAIDHAERLAAPGGGGTGDRNLESISSLRSTVTSSAAENEAVAQSAGDSSAALLRAFQAENLAGARAALEAGADPNLRSDYHGGPLIASAATSFGDDSWVQLLLQYGADPNARENSSWTPLQGVANSAGPEYRARIAQRLIDAGAVVDAQNSDGGTALIYACLQGDDGAGMVELLVAAGADPNLPTFMGTPAAFANSMPTLYSAIQRGIARRR